MKRSSHFVADYISENPSLDLRKPRRMSELGSQSALLSRLWALASSPLEPIELEDQAEKLKVFCESCVNPQTGKVNVDVARSLLPQEWTKEFDKFSDILAKEHEKSSTYLNIAQQSRDVDKLSKGATNTEKQDNDLESTTTITSNGGFDDQIYANKEEFGEQSRMDVDSLELQSEVDVRKSQNVYILPVNIPEPNKNSLKFTELHYQVQSQPLTRLLALNHKVLTTDAFKTSLMESRLAVIFGRIGELKRLEKWGLRQLKRFVDPPRSASHWDHLLSEAKFVNAGIKGDRRLKMAICHSISLAVLDYFARKAKHVAQSDLNYEHDHLNQEDKPDARKSIVEEEEFQGKNDVMNIRDEKVKQIDSLIVSLTKADAPSIVSFNDLDISSQEILHSIAAMKLFDPIYSDRLINSMGAVPISKFMSQDLDFDWKRVLIEELANEVDVKSSIVTDNSGKSALQLNFKTKSEEIRPPQPPSQQFLNVRVANAWHPEDDARLLQLVCDFHNNWGLIASLLSQATCPGTNIGAGSSAGVGNEFGAGVASFASNVERRTPWQVFERWVSISQIDPKEFKGRFAEQARNWFDASVKLSACRKRQAPVNLSSDAWLRGHRKLRWTSMLEGIRKVKRKRETAPKPNNIGFLSKQRNDQTRPAKMNSARELSKMKFERDKQVSDQFNHPRMVSQAQAQVQGRVSTNSNQSGHNMSVNVAKTVPRPTPGPGVMTGMPLGHQNIATDSANMIRSGPTGNANAGNSGPSSSRLPPLGVPPSIAGIPMPASVAAAAVARQKQRQQQMQAQMKNMGYGAAGVGQESTQGVSDLAHGMTTGTVAGLSQRNMHPTRLRQQQSESPLNSPSISPMFPVAQMSNRPQSMPNRLTPTVDKVHKDQRQHLAQQVQGQKGQPISQVPQGSQGPQVGGQRPKTAIPFSREQIQELMTQIAQKHTNLTPQEVQQLAVQNVRKYMMMQAERQAAQRNAANASAGSHFQPPQNAHDNAQNPQQ